MAMVPLGLAGPSYKTVDALIVSPQVTLNYYPEVIEQIIGGVSRVSELRLVPTPGTTAVFNRTGTTVGGVRGMKVYDEGQKLIAVIGPDVYIIGTDFNASRVYTTLSNDDLPVRIVPNVNGQVFILSNKAGYVYTLATNSVSPITDPDLLASIDAGFLSSYIIALRDRLQQFQISSSNAAQTYSALEFTTLEADEDKQVGLICDRLEVWFFGQKKTLIYYDSGNLEFPIERRPGGVLEIGCGARDSIHRINGYNTWLACNENGDKFITRAKGYGDERISNHALETAMTRYPRTDDCRAFGQLDRGHPFSWFYFPSADATWVFDHSNKLWHQRSYWDVATISDKAHKAACGVTFQGQILVGDHSAPLIYRMSPSLNTDNGDLIRRERICPHIIKQARSGEYLEYKAVRLFAETAAGLSVDVDAAGENPMISLSWSDDGGRTWSNELPVSMGKLGAYKTILEWRQLGATNIARTFKFTCFDITPYQLLEAFADVE